MANKMYTQKEERNNAILDTIGKLIMGIFLAIGVYHFVMCFIQTTPVVRATIVALVFTLGIYCYHLAVEE